MKKFSWKKYIFYHFRWQTSGFVIAPVIYLLDGNPILAAIIGNFIGACLYWFLDKWLFSHKKQEESNGKYLSK